MGCSWELSAPYVWILSELCSCPSYLFIFPPQWGPLPCFVGWSRCWPRWCDCSDLTPSSFELQRMSQRHGPHQGARVGWRRWHQVASEATFQTWIGRLPGPDHHRGPHAQRGNGCLVQSRYILVVILTCSHHGFDSVYLMWMNIDFSVVKISYTQIDEFIHIYPFQVRRSRTLLWWN